MDNYIIAPAGNGFRIVETLPDGRYSTVEGFPTEAGARGWLDSFMILVELMDCLAGHTVRHGSEWLSDTRLTNAAAMPAENRHPNVEGGKADGIDCD